MLASLGWILFVIYLIGAIGTLLFHISLIVGPITRPGRLLLSAVFWPRYLPVLIAASREGL